MIKISEMEDKLLVSSHHVFSEITHAIAIGKFILSEPEEHQIVDAYYDTEEGIFRKNAGYIRLRSKDGDHFITVRLISNQILNEITHSLGDAGLKLVFESIFTLNSKFRKPDLSKPNFIEVLNSVGLIERTRVANRRIIRDVIVENRQIGKMKCDNFRFTGLKEEYFEIETDIYNSEYQKEKDQLITALLAKYPNSLTKHSASKYELGMNALNC